jgi:hypothetical protein
MRGFVQTWERRVDLHLWPQPVDELFPMQPPSLRQSEHLDERRRVTPCPRRIRDPRPVDLDGEGVQEVDLYRHGNPPSVDQYVDSDPAVEQMPSITTSRLDPDLHHHVTPGSTARTRPGGPRRIQAMGRTGAPQLLLA